MRFLGKPPYSRKSSVGDTIPSPQDHRWTAGSRAKEESMKGTVVSVSWFLVGFALPAHASYYETWTVEGEVIENTLTAWGLRAK